MDTTENHQDPPPEITPPREHPPREPEPPEPVDYDEYDAQWPDTPIGEG